MLWGALVAASVFQAPGLARADEASPSNPAALEREVTLLTLHGDDLPREELRTALAGELGREVVWLEEKAQGQRAAGVVTVSYRKAQGELAVSWDGARGGTVSRVIAARQNVGDIVSDAVLLAGNLARVEADELAPAPPVPPAPAPPAAVVAAPAPRPSPVACDVSAQETTFASASFFYPLATNYGRPWIRSSLDLNLLYGRLGSLEGAQLGVVNIVSRAEGKSCGRLEGLQIGILANMVGGEARGVQAAALFNTVAGSTEGLQLAFVANTSSGPLSGFQVAAGFNYARRVSGAQIALVNVAGDVDGAQLGLINVGGRVRGASIGLVNVADDIDGVPLAPISVTRSGGVHAAFWSGSRGFANAGVKFATRSTYTMLTANYHRDFERDFLGGGAVIGGRIHVGARFHVDIDLGSAWLIAPELSVDAESERQYHEQLVASRVRALLGWRAVEHFGLFVGPAGLVQVRSELGWDRVSAVIAPEIVGGVEF